MAAVKAARRVNAAVARVRDDYLGMTFMDTLSFRAKSNARTLAAPAEGPGAEMPCSGSIVREGKWLLVGSIVFF